MEREILREKAFEFGIYICLEIQNRHHHNLETVVPMAEQLTCDRTDLRSRRWPSTGAAPATRDR